MLDILIGENIEDESISFDGDMRSLVADTVVVIAGLYGRLKEINADAAEQYRCEITKAVDDGIPFKLDG